MQRFKLVDRKHYYLVAFVAALLLSVAVFEYFEAQATLRAEDERIQFETQQMARTIEEYTLTTFSKVDLVLRQLQTTIEDPTIRKAYTKEKIYSLLRTMHNEISEIDVIGITDANGQYITNTLFPPEKLAAVQPPPNVSDRPYFIKHRAEKSKNIIVSDPVLGKTTKHLNVVLSRALLGAKGEFLGVILASINLGTFSQVFSELGQVDEEIISLYNTQRILLARFPFVTDQIGKYIPTPEALKKRLAEGQQNGTYSSLSPVDGIYRTNSFKIVRNWPLLVLVGRSQNKFLVRWQKNNYTTGTILLSLSAIILFALFRYFKSIEQQERNQMLAVNASKMSALGEMSAGMAHEINNPLAVISGQVKKIEQQLAKDPVDKEVIKSAADKITQMQSRISKIIHGLRAFARNSDGDQMVPTELYAILENTKDLTVERFKLNDVQLTIDVPIGVRISCREGQISQVLVNLLNNAFDAISDNSDPAKEKWISLKTKVTASGRVQISVIDSGPGIPSEVREKIMNPFFTTKPVNKGTALGLSISKGIIEQHGGTLRLDTSSTRTCFVIDLPIVRTS